MGSTIWIEVHGRSLRETANDCSIVHRLSDHLDILAGKLGVQKLSGFTDWNDYEVPESNDGEEEAYDVSVHDPMSDTVEERQARGGWFDATLGLQTVRELRQRLGERFEDLGFTLNKSVEHWPASLQEEFAYLEAILAEAVSQGQGFRLLVVL